jgi:hypothetical protein
MQPMLTRIVILVLVVMCSFGLYAAADTIQALPVKQAQEAALSRFGADLLKLCQGVTKTRDGTLPTEARIAAINRSNGTVFDDYDTALPANLRATDKSDVNVLLCLGEEKSVFNVDEYGKPVKYRCTQYTRDITAYLVDVKSGKTLDYRTFDGQEPPECPDKTDTNLTRTGNLPLPSDLNSWLTRRVKGNV